MISSVFEKERERGLSPKKKLLEDGKERIVYNNIEISAWKEV